MTEKIYKERPAEGRQICRSPLDLFQAVIFATPAPTFAGCWIGTPPEIWVTPNGSITDMERSAVPKYIKAMHGHSGTRRVSHTNDADWEVTPKHTTHVYHASYLQNLDSILRNGLITGGPT